MIISNWGLYPHTDATVVEWGGVKSLQKTLSNIDGVITRGMGRCYGDSSLNDAIISSLRGNRILSFDSDKGILQCEAGVTLAEILELFVPKGWFPPVVPGTKFITIGGAIASDVHGKNHHIEGSFTKHVIQIEIMLADGQVVSCARDKNPELFLATCGGMGLTGIILSAIFQLKPIVSTRIRMDSIKAANIDELMSLLIESAQWTYTVAWIDCLSKGRNMGRGILMRGEHAEQSNIGTEAQLQYIPKRSINVPLFFPGAVLNSSTMALFNALYYNKQRAKHTNTIIDFNSFFFPLDFLDNWNRIYGRRGFMQYQFVVPKEAGAAGLKEILEEIVKARKGSFLAVLKWFGPQGEGLISFPREGFTLALDFPLTPDIFDFLKTLDKKVLKYNGRLYLAKDARMDRIMFSEGYNNSQIFFEFKKMIDPMNKFQSIQSRRLGVGQ